jgi:hypothetical protein
MEEGGTTDDVTTVIDESEFIDIIVAAENESDFHENNDTEEASVRRRTEPEASRERPDEEEDCSLENPLRKGRNSARVQIKYSANTSSLHSAEFATQQLRPPSDKADVSTSDEEI